MADHKFRVTLARTVIETVTLNVEAPTKYGAALAAVTTLKDGEDWAREVGTVRVASVERQP